MKKGPIILVILGLGIAIGLYFAPVSPSDTEIQEEGVENVEETSVASGETLSPEERVDAALNELKDGNTPPMLVIKKIIAVADEYPKNVKAHFTLGVLAMQTGQFQKAIGRFETVLSVESQNINAFQFLASAHLNLGDTATAKNYLSEAADFATDSAQVVEISTALEKLNIN